MFKFVSGAFLILFIPTYTFANVVEGWNDPGPRNVRPGPTIRIQQGLIRGEIEFYDIFRSHISYKGIPYGQAPVGELRWRAPKPAQGWNGIRSGSLFGPNCPQIGSPIIGTRQMFVTHEDCLYINVFTPNERNLRNLPVIFHIHMGGFHGESGDGNLNSWKFFPNEGIIYVTFNYRLDVLGHLNTEDEHATGNYALKDILLALKWVQNNIEAFGGDKENVVLMGPSIGGVVVQALILSEHARGLFHKAISMGGSLFQTFAIRPNPKERAESLARSLNINWTDSKDMVTQLRQVSSERLINATFNFFPTQMPTLFVPRSFVPSIDAPSTDEIKILPQSPDILVRNGTFNDVPLLVGFNSVESMTNMLFPDGITRFNENPNLLIPDAWQIEANSQEANEIINGIRRVYFNGSDVIRPDMLWQWTQFCSDRELIFGVSKLIDFHYKRQPVYYYRFSYSGSLSFSQILFGLAQYPGATMFDDQMYLHRMNRFDLPVPRTDHAFIVRRRFIRMIRNFAFHGNPTPSREILLQNIRWPQVSDNLDFVDIGHDLVVGVHPFKDRMDMWRDFDRRFNKF
ncbi:CLUMA_CG010871, isoform A [Clunio marinus]|uniref:CLUMA_CG010871, isoform A n=1 Tax=Clunio marinus TaxID=568069 RepID=A0A1J1ICK0_9DIPT|nr:CLUMA_CG010871, isoform A [Clunio marinus]